MNGIEIIILIIAIVIIAGAIAAYLTRGQKSLKEMTQDYYNNEEAQEVVELAQELYNRDLRPVIAKKSPKAKKSEFPIDQPTKKTKVVEQVETITEAVTPEVVEKVIGTAKVTPKQSIVNVEEAVAEPAKPKKKRKYYPRKPKTSI
jgi:flagellar basal body-associated protein FliL